MGLMKKLHELKTSGERDPVLALMRRSKRRFVVNDEPETFPVGDWMVIRKDGHYTCNCPHFTLKLRGKSDCKHIKSVKAEQGKLF